MKRIFYRTGCLLAATLLLFGCKDFFNPETPDSLQESDYISSATELYSGYFGIATEVMKVIDQGMYLEGLRGELLEPTTNAPQDFWDLYNYVDRKGGSLRGNELANPKGYYAIVLNANDYIKHVFDYREQNPNALSDTEFRGLIGGALRFKAWAYLQIIKYWGEAVYIDDPLIKYQDISNFPMWNFDQILDKCIDLVETGVNGIDGRTEFNWLTVLDPATTSPADLESQDRSRNKTCPPAFALLAEMYLWKGDYPKVKENYILMLTSSYIRWNDTRAFVPYVVDVDTRSYGGTNYWQRLHIQYVQRAHIAGAIYNYEYQQINKLQPYFSTRYDRVRWTDSEGQEHVSGYYLRPAQTAMDKFIAHENWYGDGNNSETHTGGRNNRGRGWTFDGYDTDRPYLRKFIRTVDGDVNQWYRTVTWITMYRDKGVQLHLVEALIEMGRFDEALLFLNGEGQDKNITRFNQLIDRVVGSPTNGQYRAGTILEGYPNQLAGVNWGGSQRYPNLGIRSHVGMDPLGKEVLTNPNPDIRVDQSYLASLVADETFYEFAGEGQALPAMIRIAKHHPELRPALAAKVAAKYNNGTGDDAIEALLAADLNNWFVKFPLQEE